ncbi:MAG: DegT/DnrJ/EryC1/StrS family aminotransferase [Deltaproteobacteria bacterium]|jgi:dTDP-4-amino-4,6-dideoxygalactose transaminase|nr:DegT/DnrJ/EryC1/StrS family aminotransferase [Deltaproteobacteria bacterium]
MDGVHDPIPLLDLQAQHRGIEAELISAITNVVASGRFVLATGVESFESDLAKLCEVRRAVSCNSGTDALWLALHALGIGPGDAVLCPAFSFVATASTVVRLGARPVFADIDPATFNLDPQDAIRRAEGESDLRAIITADLFGRLCELGDLAAFARERGLPIVEDAAQSIGALDEQGARPGSRTTAACFSFYPTKNLGALGDGGGVVTSDPALARRIESLRGHCENGAGVYDTIGINSRLDEIQAVALSVKLRHLESWNAARRELAAHYDALFAARGAATTSQPPETSALGLRTPAPCHAPGRHTYHRYVVRVAASRRAELIERLRGQGIGCEVYYPTGLHQQPALAAFAPSSPLPETLRASQEALAIPLYPEMGFERVERVVEAVTRILER